MSSPPNGSTGGAGAGAGAAGNGGNGDVVGASAADRPIFAFWSDAHRRAKEAENAAKYDDKCYDDVATNMYELPNISSFNPTEPRLVEYDIPLRTIYSIYLCLKKIPRGFKITERKHLDYLKECTTDEKRYNIEALVSRVFPEWTPEKRAALVGLFVKMFDKQCVYPIWPPTNYPENDMPELCKIKGFIDESPLNSTIRILGTITESQNYTNVIDTFNKLKSMPLSDANALVNRIAKPEWDKKGNLMSDNRTFYFNTDSEVTRFLGPIKHLTWDQYLYETFLNATYYTEFTFDPLYGKPLNLSLYMKKCIKRDQQCFLILPSNIDVTTYRIFDTAYSLENPPPMEPLSREAEEARQAQIYKPLTDIHWIQLNDTLDENIPENGACMYQGYRLTNLPHPRLLIAIAKGVKNMSEHMRSLFPEFSTDESRERWLDATLEKWRRDIESITNTHQRFIQQYLYNDASMIIKTIFTKVPRIDANIKLLAANAINTDPNAMFNRVYSFQQRYASVLQPLKAAGKLEEIKKRSEARRWYGAAVESKEAYRAKLKAYISQIQRLLGGPSEVSTAVDSILKLTRMPKPNTREIYAQFDAWRRSLLPEQRSKLPPMLVRDIDAVRPAGIFERAVGYAQKIGKLVMDAQPAAPITVATAVLDRTLATIDSGVKTLKEDIGTLLPASVEKTTILRELESLPAATYDKSSTDSVYRYLVALLDTLVRAFNAYTVFIKRVNTLEVEVPAPPLRRIPAHKNLTNLPGARALNSHPETASARSAVNASSVAAIASRGQGGGRRKHRKSHRTGKEMGKHRRTHKHQRGGASMPLAYFQDGAQMRGTYTESTGVGLGAATNAMVRSTIHQTGGRRGQAGGFAPSIMGPVVQNGMYLMPLASFMSYKMMKGRHRSSTRRGGRLTHKKRRSTRRS